MNIVTFQNPELASVHPSYRNKSRLNSNFSIILCDSKSAKLVNGMAMTCPITRPIHSFRRRVFFLWDFHASLLMAWQWPLLPDHFLQGAAVSQTKQKHCIQPTVMTQTLVVRYIIHHPNVYSVRSQVQFTISQWFSWGVFSKQFFTQRCLGCG